ncbi:MAG TPA: HdeD family acid-resistance protein [Gammaproteobacteria bacterium]|nr:HdeD family acid-resistance protein [Gammaproteobacteria bacterium]
MTKTTQGGTLIDALRENSGWAIAIGILLLIAGILAIGSPFVTGLAVTVSVGALLVLSGLGQCFLAFQAGAFGRGLLIFLLGLIAVVAGVYMVSQPVSGLASLTLLLAGYFIVTGILTIITALQLRPASGWGWMLANAIVTLLLGVLIWRQWPLSGTWAVGTLFGVQMLMSGFSLLTTGSAVRQVTHAAAAAR